VRIQAQAQIGDVIWFVVWESDPGLGKRPLGSDSQPSLEKEIRQEAIQTSEHGMRQLPFNSGVIKKMPFLTGDSTKSADFSKNRRRSSTSLSQSYRQTLLFDAKYPRKKVLTIKLDGGNSRLRLQISGFKGNFKEDAIHFFEADSKQRAIMITDSSNPVFPMIIVEEEPDLPDGNLSSKNHTEQEKTI
jgi:hypothetical protein